MSWLIEGFSRPRCGEVKSGDRFFCCPRGEEHLVAVVDVLGHGCRAHEVALNIEEQLVAASSEPLPKVFEAVAKAAAPRGCALFLGLMKNSEIQYTMIGNTRGWLMEESGRLEILRHQPGVVGRLQVVPTWRRLLVGDKAWLLICTDGVKQSFVPRPGWLKCTTPREAARLVVQEWGMPEDDVTVMVCGRFHDSGR